MNIDLPPGSELYADSAYTDFKFEQYYKEYEEIELRVARKKNAKIKDHPAMRFLKQTIRKNIEVTFSQITAAFPKKIHAVTPKGFMIKIVLFIFAFTLQKSVI